MLLIVIAVAAAALQVARNATQRSLMPGAGPWGATLVRFLFGLPFTVVFLALAWGLAPDARLHVTGVFWAAAALGGAAQIGATAALLVSMQRSSFTLGSTFQQSQLPFTALVGFFVFGDGLSPAAWTGIALVTVGLAALSWPKTGLRGDWSGAWLGLLAGVLFALSANGFRQGALSLGPAPAALAGVATLLAAQALQTAALAACLAVFDRRSLASAVRSWRPSLRAGFFGSAASACWFTAFAMAPAGQVKAIAVVEMPIAALAGRRLFADRLGPLQLVAGAVTALGVVMAALL